MTEHPAHSLADDAARLAPRRAARSLCLYAVAAVAATAFFIWLHHLGNGIPYELAQQRFAAGPLTGGPDSDVSFDAHFEYCEIASAVMVGARDKTEYGPLVDAILPRNLAKRTEHSNYCPEAKAEARGADVRTRVIQFRYWWGGKAIFAIALRWLSVLEFHRFIEVATYAAWLAFAGAMALHGARGIDSLPSARRLRPRIFGRFDVSRRSQWIVFPVGGGDGCPARGVARGPTHGAGHGAVLLCRRHGVGFSVAA